MRPIKLAIKNKGLVINWDDESQQTISLSSLRKRCPCATCLSEREKQSKDFFPIFNPDQIKVTGLKTVGTYALNICWGDGHSTGIFEYRYLKNFNNV